MSVYCRYDVFVGYTHTFCAMRGQRESTERYLMRCRLPYILLYGVFTLRCTPFVTSPISIIYPLTALPAQITVQYSIIQYNTGAVYTEREYLGCTFHTRGG